MDLESLCSSPASVVQLVLALYDIDAYEGYWALLLGNYAYGSGGALLRTLYAYTLM